MNVCVFGEREKGFRPREGVENEINNITTTASAEDDKDDDD